MLKKKFLKSKCKVTFELPEGIAEGAETVNLVGDFNNWVETATPMDKKGGRFTVTLDLGLDSEYEFRYLINGNRWENDWNADAYRPAGGYLVDNSVVSTHQNGKR